MGKLRSELFRRLENGLDGLLPRHCLLCGLVSGKNNLCRSCRTDLPRIERGCAFCGQPLTLAADRHCAACLRRVPPWDHALAALTYEFPVDHLVRRFKFNSSLASGLVLGEELLHAVRRAHAVLPDSVVPVPLHRMRHFARGYNQAERLARMLGTGLGLPVRTDILARIRRTAAQSGLNADIRRRNLKGAFRSGPGTVAGHMALVDDVLTTGATMAECTCVLKRAGVGRVSIWVAAVTPANRQRW